MKRRGIIKAVMKMRKYEITEEEYKALKIAAKNNKNKKVDKWLQIPILRYEGLIPILI